MKRILLALSASAVFVVTGCAKRPAPQATLPSATPGATTGGIAMNSFPNPGPHKIVEITEPDGTKAEYLEARGDIGKFGGTFKVCTFGGGPKTFNPWNASDVPSGGLALLMFDRLVDIDPWTGKPYPKLAKSFQVSKDKLEYTFVMRKGLKWSDGKPLTADDVVFTFDDLVRRGYGNSSNRDVLTVYGEYPKVWKVDDLTVKFKTKRPFAPFLNAMNSIPIAPKHIMEKYTKRPVNDFRQVWDVTMKPADMVCSGPFILDRYVPSQRVELKRISNYGMVDTEGRKLPYVDRFVETIVPDQNTMILKFLGKEVDLLDVRAVRGVDAAMLKGKEKALNFTMYNLGADDGTYFLMFNMNQRVDPKKKKPYVDPIKQKWFNNVHFRDAVSHAINRKQIVSNVLRGVGVPLYTAEPTSSLFYNPDLAQFPQDLEKAKSLLAQGGFVMKGDKLHDADGHPVEFILQTNAGNTTREAICNHVKDVLKPLGIKVNFQPIDFNILVGKTEDTLDWEAIVMALSGSRLEPYEGANVWKSDGRLHMFDQRLPNDKGTVVVTDARPWEKEIDSLFDLGATTFEEPKRREYFNKFQRIAYQQQPFIYLVSILDLTTMRNTVGNYKPMPWGISYTPRGSLHNVEEIFFKDAKQQPTPEAQSSQAEGAK